MTSELKCDHVYGNVGGYDPLLSIDKDMFDKYRDDPDFEGFKYCPECGVRLDAD